MVKSDSDSMRPHGRAGRAADAVCDPSRGRSRGHTLYLYFSQTRKLSRPHFFFFFFTFSKLMAQQGTALKLITLVCNFIFLLNLFGEGSEERAVGRTVRGWQRQLAAGSLDSSV